MAKKIIDIYHAETITSFDAVCNATELIIHKGAEGMAFTDPKCAARIKEFEKRRHPYWIYVFLSKGNELAQAKRMVSIYKDVVGKYFVGYILDIERENTQDGCLEALNYLLTVDCKVMFYFQYSKYTAYPKLIAKRSERCAFWECRYGDDAGNRVGTDRSERFPFHYTADLGQFTEYGKCAGMAGSTDLNKVTGNGKTLEWFKTPLKVAAVTPAPMKQAVQASKPERINGVNYFTEITNKNTGSLTEFLHKRGFGAGKPNLSKIAAANAESREVEEALFKLAQKGLLVKPEGLNKKRLTH